jgi:hypothetical protein
VSLRTGDLAYLHTHPADEAHGDQRGGPTVRFGTEFPTAGTYRAFHGRSEVRQWENQTVYHLSLRGAQRRSNPSSPFDKLRAPSLSRGWIAAPSFLGLAMTNNGRCANIDSDRSGLRRSFPM